VWELIRVTTWVSLLWTYVMGVTFGVLVDELAMETFCTEAVDGFVKATEWR